MGFTPLDGLAMGTRCGTIDPAAVTFLMNKEKLSTDEMDCIMNKKSGFMEYPVCPAISGTWRRP